MNSVRKEMISIIETQKQGKIAEVSESAQTMGYADTLAEKLYTWMAGQKYGEENLLHAAVCCDFVGRTRFINKLAKLIRLHDTA